MEGRWFLGSGQLEDLLGSDQQVVVAVKAEVAGDAGAGSVGTDDEPRPDSRRPVATEQVERVAPASGVARAQDDAHAGGRSGGRRRGVERRHVSYAVLVAAADQGDGAAQVGRVEDDPSNRWAEVLGRQREVVECLPHEDPRGADRADKTGSPVDQEDAVALPCEERGGVEAGQSGADDEDIRTGRGPEEVGAGRSAHR
ncbi:hypothetical protein SCJ33.13c [Streptomyces coelicolor A3(2)]|uniref:Uncharacterized protein n=1 Tax=Streptomyces coelicolor (strain ATCC BAA-471 / A3(2) / M145) TaxID=100226 RepID=Q9RIW5_STRCO|nr:hypothetical protein SCJ33.13c [Streptomyces coelicolor A3(2)]